MHNPSGSFKDRPSSVGVARALQTGAKAIAWEATSKRIGPEFFAKHSIAELAAQSEQWLGDQGRNPLAGVLVGVVPQHGHEQASGTGARHAHRSRSGSHP